MTTKIKFFTEIEELQTAMPPIPASKFWPEWFKKQNPKLNQNSPMYASTVRKCPAILDILSMGYIIPLWCDFKLKRVHNNVQFMTPPAVADHFQMTTHAKVQIEHYPFNKDTFNGSVKFFNPWSIVTPPGYSVMLVSPYYQTNPHIEAMQGIIDTDSYHEIHVNTFFTAPLDETIELPRGMPLVQVIPFKRENYEMETLVGNHSSMIGRARNFIFDSMFDQDSKRYRDNLYTKRYK